MPRVAPSDSRFCVVVAVLLLLLLLLLLVLLLLCYHYDLFLGEGLIIHCFWRKRDANDAMSVRIGRRGALTRRTRDI